MLPPRSGCVILQIMSTRALLFISLTLSTIPALTAELASAKHPSMADVLASSKPENWRPLDPENTLYLELATVRVIIELAPTFAPKHVANVKALIREHYFDGLAIVRAQDNYVVQLADPDAEKPTARKIKNAKPRLPPEFERAMDASVAFTRLEDSDVYAPQVGFSDGF